MQTFLLGAIAFPIIMAIDLLWVGVAGSGFYRSQLGTMLSPAIFWPAAIAFYVIYCLALAFFVISPAVEAKSVFQALLWGSFFGLAAYAAYDLTNLAIVSNWPLVVTIVDLAWGVVLTALASSLTYLVATKLLHF